MAKRDEVIRKVKALSLEERNDAAADALMDIANEMCGDLDLNPCMFLQAVVTLTYKVMDKAEHGPCIRALFTRLMAGPPPTGNPFVTRH